MWTARAGIMLEAVWWHERFHEEGGLVTTHLILSPLPVPSTFRVEPLFEDVLGQSLFDMGEQQGVPAVVKQFGSFLIISIGVPCRKASPSQKVLNC